MLRYSLGQEYAETRPATEEEKAHVRTLAEAALRRRRILGFLLLVGLAVFVVGIALIFSFGMLIVLFDLFVMAGLLLAWGDAGKVAPILKQSMNLTEVAVYGDPSDKRSSVLHPTTGLLIKSGGQFVEGVFKIDGAVIAEQEPHPEAGWYPAEREHDLGLDRRPLSSVELEELKRLSLLFRARFNFPLFIAGWICLGGLIAAFDPKEPAGQAVAFLCGMGLLIVIGIHVYWAIPALKLWRDRRGKQVMRAEVDNKRIELLPYSRIIWTEDGGPSALRRDGMYHVIYWNP